MCIYIYILVDQNLMFEMIWIMRFSRNNLGMSLTNLGDFAKHYTTPAGDVSRFTASWKLCTNLNPFSIILHRPIFQKRWILVLFGSLLLFPKRRSHERLRQDACWWILRMMIAKCTNLSGFLPNGLSCQRYGSHWIQYAFKSTHPGNLWIQLVPSPSGQRDQRCRISLWQWRA